MEWNGTRPKRIRDRAAKKQALILAALGLFASKGYEVTTTREIAASAGCAEGLIHRYFKGKAGLLAAMIENRVSKEELGLGHQLRPAPSLEDEFLQLVDREVERMWESRDFLRVFIPRAIVDPSVGQCHEQGAHFGTFKAISKRLKHYESCASLPQERDGGSGAGGRNARPGVRICAARCCSARIACGRKKWQPRWPGVFRGAVPRIVYLLSA